MFENKKAVVDRLFIEGKDSMRILPALLLLLTLSCPCVAQNYQFNYGADDKFQIRSEGSGLYYLFKISEKKVTPSVFRKVFLDETLKPVNAIEYTVDGAAELIQTGSNQNYSYHLFYSKVGKMEQIHFIVTEKDGRIHSSFTKPSTYFQSFFGQSKIKLKKLQFDFIDDYSGNGSALLMQTRMFYTSLLKSELTALNIETGNQEWKTVMPHLDDVQTTEDRIIGLNAGSDHTISFINKTNGEIIKTIAYYIGKANRALSVMTTNGKELLLAGVEYPNDGAKNGQFFLSIYDLEGTRMFDRLDTASRFSSKRMSLMGSTFDENGDLVLAGQGWKVDPTRAIATTVIGIAAAALIGGPAIYSAQMDVKIDQLIFATISPDNGMVKNFKTFPVGPWAQFGRLMTDGEHMLLRYNNTILIYYPNEPETSPQPFTTLNAMEDLFLAPFGPVILHNDRQANVLTLSPLREWRK